MTKLDRLVRLAKLQQAGKPLTIRRMSELCGVSERTVYRYLNTLTDLDVEDTFRRKQLSGLVKRLAQFDLTADDLELVSQAFSESSLAEYPCFRRRFRRVGEALSIVVSATGGKRKPRLIHRVGRFSPLGRAAGSKTVQRFLDAAARGRSMHVRNWQGRTSTRLLPVGLLSGGGELSLEFLDVETGRKHTIKLRDLNSAKLARERS